MKALQVLRLPELYRQFRTQFPKAWRDALWKEVEPREYDRGLTASALVLACLRAFVLRLPGQRELAQDPSLNVSAHASVSYALRRPSSGAFVEGLVARLESGYTSQPFQLEAVDGMPLTLPKTRRHRCQKVNNKTVGGGVIWSYQLDKPPGTPGCPVKVLKVLEGAWHDGSQMRTVALVPDGPVYLVDRGFYTLALLVQWLLEKVHFIGRARQQSLKYEVLETLSAPRRAGGLELKLDARVRLGGPRAEHHPVVRLVWAVLASGEDLVLVTDLMDAKAWPAEALLSAYKRRGEIEGFHKFLKDCLGLAHVYSFAWPGLRFLLHTALLGALLLFLCAGPEPGRVTRLMREVLRRVRRACGLPNPWKRNIAAPRRNKKKKKKGRPRAPAMVPKTVEQ